MGIVIRQSISTTVITYAGILIGYVNVLYLFPRFLDPSQVGLLRTIQDAAILFSPFAQFGLAQSIIRYYPQVVREKRLQPGFISLILLLALGGFIIFLVVFKVFEGSILDLFSENAAAVIEYVPVVLWLTFILLITALLEAYSRSLLKTVFPNLMREVAIRGMLALLVTAYFLGWLSFNAFIISTVLAYLLALLALVAYLMASRNLAVSLQFSFIETAKKKELILYSLLSFAGAAGMIIIGKIDSLMIAPMLGLPAVAVYTTAFYMASVIEVPKRALSAVTMPLISQAFDKNDMQHIATLYRKTSINQFIIGSLLLIGIVINLDSMYSIMPKREIYEAGRWVVVFVGIGKLVDMAFGPSSEIVVLSKYFWFNIVLILLLAASVITMNRLLIPIYGINGAAMGVAFALILFNVVKYVFIRITLKIQPFSWSTLLVATIAAATFGINFLIPSFDHLLVDMIVRSGVVTVIYSSLILATKVSPDINNFLKARLKRLG